MLSWAAPGFFLPAAVMGARRSQTAMLPWASAALMLGWGYLWLVAGARGVTVHLVLAVAFALLIIWGLLRAT